VRSFELMNSTTVISWSILQLRGLVASLLFITIIAVASAVVANGQTPSSTPDDEPDFIVPARPTVSNPAEFQKPGVLQLEFGYNANFHANRVSAEQDTPLALRFAISRRLLVEVDTDSPFSQTVSDGGSATGLSDTQVGIQAVLHHKSQSRPGVALAYYIKWPTASSTKGLGTGRVDHILIALVSKKINRTTIDFNGIYLLAGRAGRHGSTLDGWPLLAAPRVSRGHRSGLDPRDR